MDTRLSLVVVQCRQFDPVSGPFSMNNERNEAASVYSVGSQKNLVPVKSRHAYFKKRSQLPSLLLFGLLFLVTSLLIVVIVLSVLYARFSRMELCDSEDCMRIAASLKESMNTSVDPCDNFYEYVCGRWPQEHPIPDSSFTNSWFNERSDRIARTIRDLLRVNMSQNVPWAVSQAKILYTSCMDSDAMNALGLNPLFDLLERLGLSPIPAVFTKKTGNYIDQIAMVKRVLGMDVFFGFDIVRDPRNKSNNIIYLGPPDMSSTLPGDKDLEKRLQSIRSRLRKLQNDETGTENDGIDDEYNEAEMTYMTEVIEQIVSNGTVDSCALESNETFSREIDKVVKTLYRMSSAIYYISSEDQNSTLTEEYLTDSDYMLIDDLQKLTDEYAMEVNSSLTLTPLWRPFIEKLFDGILDTLDLSKKDKILVGNLEYLKDIAVALAATREESLETYIWWIVVDMVVPHSSENLRKSWETYLKKLMDVEIGEPKSLKCANAVNYLMGMAVSWLFVDPSFHENEGLRVREMFEDIKQAFATVVMNTDWMDKKTQSATLTKNDKMVPEIGFPEWLFEEGELDDYYSGIDLTETEYLRNMVQITQLDYEWMLQCLQQVNYDNFSQWATDPTDVNAFHTFQLNKITIPAGILQFPFYELGLEALNYGAIGTVLGHELTHGFDNNGRHYDSDGNLRQWWTNETSVEYTQRTECFIKHYSSYYEDEVDDYIDGELTLGENIADNGGLREAVIAYRRWKDRHGQEPFLPGFTHLTHEQLVFLGFAHLWCEANTPNSLKWMLQDSHCPGHVRLQAVLKNSKEFSEAWNCPVGSNMNPPSKCHVW